MVIISVCLQIATYRRVKARKELSHGLLLQHWEPTGRYPQREEQVQQMPERLHVVWGGMLTTAYRRHNVTQSNVLPDTTKEQNMRFTKNDRINIFSGFLHIGVEFFQRYVDKDNLYNI